MPEPDYTHDDARAHSSLRRPAEINNPRLPYLLELQQRVGNTAVADLAGRRQQPGATRAVQRAEEEEVERDPVSGAAWWVGEHLPGVGGSAVEVAHDTTETIDARTSSRRALHGAKAVVGEAALVAELGGFEAPELGMHTLTALREGGALLGESSTLSASSVLGGAGLEGAAALGPAAAVAGAGLTGVEIGMEGDDAVKRRGWLRDRSGRAQSASDRLAEHAWDADENAKSWAEQPGALFPHGLGETASGIVGGAAGYGTMALELPAAAGVATAGYVADKGASFIDGVAHAVRAVEGMGGDADIRAFVKTQSNEELTGLPAEQKANMISRLLDGWVSDDDLAAIEKIWSCATPDDRAALRGPIEERAPTLSSIQQRTRLRVMVSS